MNCAEVLTQLEQLVDGELAPPAKGQVEGHLSRCKRCASTLETLLREQVDLRAGLTFEELPEAKRQALERRTLRAIEEAEGGRVPVPAPRSREVASLFLVSMASCLVAVAAMLLVGWDTQAGSVRLADSLSAARGTSNMAAVLLTSVSATILVLAAGRLGWLWSRVTKGEC